MKRAKRIYILLAVLAVSCIATFAAIKFEEHKEQIQNSEEVILEVAAEEVQSLSWKYDQTDLSFTRDENGDWYWTEDNAFPVSEDKIKELLEVFASFGVSFIIEEVEDYSQYGLDTPVCTIELATSENSYTIELGDFSKLDSKRYVSIGDGKAYLVNTDPMDTYEITIRDMIENDKPLDYDTVTAINYSGNEMWSVAYNEESTNSVCAEDVYFTGSKPLDADSVMEYLNEMSMLDLTNYVTYNATEEELETYGLNEPEQTIVVEYTTEGETEAESISDSYTLHISRSAEERAKGEAAEAEQAAVEQVEAEETEESEEWADSYVAYARVGESPIIYEISASSYEVLIKAGYDDLRHKEVFTADFYSVTSMDIELEGKHYSLTAQADESEEESALWFFGEKEIDTLDIQLYLEALSATEFIDISPTGQQEIKLTLSLDNEHFPQMEIVLCRYDGSSCLAVIDGETFALIPRSDAVNLIEAVNEIVLN